MRRIYANNHHSQLISHIFDLSTFHIFVDCNLFTNGKINTEITGCGCVRIDEERDHTVTSSIDNSYYLRMKSIVTTYQINLYFINCPIMVAIVID